MTMISSMPSLGATAVEVWRAFQSLESTLHEGYRVYPRARILGLGSEFLFMPCYDHASHGDPLNARSGERAVCLAPRGHQRLAVCMSAAHTRWATDAECDALFAAIETGRAEIYFRPNRLIDAFQNQAPRKIVHAATAPALAEAS